MMPSDRLTNADTNVGTTTKRGCRRNDPASPEIPPTTIEAAQVEEARLDDRNVDSRAFCSFAAVPLMHKHSNGHVGQHSADLERLTLGFNRLTGQQVAPRRAKCYRLWPGDSGISPGRI
jgi:hypothetical protein